MTQTSTLNGLPRVAIKDSGQSSSCCATLHDRSVPVRLPFSTRFFLCAALLHPTTTDAITRSSAAAPRNAASGGGFAFLEADSTSTMLQIYHKINLAILGLAPIAVLSSSSPLQMPFDVMLGIALPMHGHIGMNLVGTDYVAKFFGKAAVFPFRAGMAGFTGLTMLGLLKLNLQGPGITESVKSFWRPKA